MLLNDQQIKEYVRQYQMIEPFMDHKIRSGRGIGHEEGTTVYLADAPVISYGLSSFGYDIRVADEYKIFAYNGRNAVVDPKRVTDDDFVLHKGDTCIIPPNSYALCRSVEYFRIPSDILCVVLGKSTYARSGLIVNVTPGEPGWEGEWTIELSNSTPRPIKVYSHEGIAQVLFLQGEVPDKLYGQDGKYQRQRGVVLPRV